MLVKTLNNRAPLGKHPPWRFINKEVIEEAAHGATYPRGPGFIPADAEEKGVVHGYYHLFKLLWRHPEGRKDRGKGVKESLQATGTLYSSEGVVLRF